MPGMACSWMSAVELLWLCSSVGLLKELISPIRVAFLGRYSIGKSKGPPRALWYILLATGAISPAISIEETPAPTRRTFYGREDNSKSRK